LERSAFWLISLWVAGFWGVGIVFFVTARYRLPAVPMLIIPAGYALTRIASTIRLRQWKSLVLHAVVILAAGILTWPMWFGQPQNDWTRDYVNLGNAMRSAGDFNGVERAYHQALAIRNDPDAHYLLARTLLSKKHVADALQHLESARRILPDSPDLLLISAQTHLTTRNSRQARELLYQLLELAEYCNLWPKRAEWATAHILLANLEPSSAKEYWEQAWSIHPLTAAEASFLRRQSMPRVLSTFRSEVENKPWDWYAQANYGMALLETDQADQALIPLRLAVELAPGKEGLCFQLARALAETDNKHEALEILEKLLQTLPESPLRHEVKTLHARLTEDLRKHLRPVSRGSEKVKSRFQSRFCPS
jgi:tetratricopeptide (TPR) repeat protein